jgi:hypothetical protein
VNGRARRRHRTALALLAAGLARLAAPRPRIALALAMLVACPLRAQDLAGASQVGASDLHDLIERALPAPPSGFAASASSTRWWGLRELETRAVALAGGWRALRVAAGLAQTGVPDVGWTTLGVAAGAASATAGAAFRAVTRRDRDEPWSARYALAREAGVELGGGAWLAPHPAWRAWASAPQMWVRGEAPPVERPLELGVRAGSGTAVWCTLRAPRPGDDGERALGMSLALPPFAVWAEVRDAPVRGSAGVSARAGPLAVRTRVDAHPALGETLRFGIEWVRRPADSP